MERNVARTLRRAAMSDKKEIVIGEPSKMMMQGVKPQNKCPELTKKGKCVRWFKICNNRCHSKF